TRLVILFGERYCRIQLCDRIANSKPMTRTGYPYVLQHLIVDLAEQTNINVVCLESASVLSESDAIQPSVYFGHDASCSNKAFASFRSRVSNPSVNHP